MTPAPGPRGRDHRRRVERPRHAAIALERAGIDDFVILERADDIGGTWRDNTYPDIAVDIPTFAYQFSFELNPTGRACSRRATEVKAYIDGYRRQVRPARRTCASDARCAGASGTRTSATVAARLRRPAR